MLLKFNIELINPIFNSSFVHSLLKLCSLLAITVPAPYFAYGLSYPLPRSFLAIARRPTSTSKMYCLTLYGAPPKPKRIVLGFYYPEQTLKGSQTPIGSLISPLAELCEPPGGLGTLHLDLKTGRLSVRVQ